MRRFLIVGCGGSGGATLAYVMDQLRSELHAAGIDRLLSGWQFVHIDVPSGAEDGPDGLANVAEQGGTYIGCGPQGSSYAILDAALSQRPGGRRAVPGDRAHDHVEQGRRDPRPAASRVGAAVPGRDHLGNVVGSDTGHG